MSCAPFRLKLPTDFIPRVKWYVYSNRIANSSSPPQLDERKPISASDGDFYLTSILGSDPGNILVRFQWPTGRYSSQVRMLSTLVYGNSQLYRKSLYAACPGNEPYMFIPEGSEIGIELENLDPVNAANVVIVFEGYHLSRISK